MEPKQYKQCQSCGMPLKKDQYGGGTEKNGSKSHMYCSSCYRDGEFITPATTAKEMQGFVDKLLRDEMKAGRLFRWLAVHLIPKLKRWHS